MKPRLLLCLLLFSGIVALMHAPAKSGESSDEILLSVRLTNKLANGKTQVRAEPHITSPVGKPFSFLSGGTLKGRLGDDDLDFGVRLDGKIERLQDGKLHLSMRLSVNSDVPQTNYRETQIVHGETCEVRCDLQVGKTKRIYCGGSEYCEIRAETVDGV